MFGKLLIANRGEIACRIIRTCRKLGVRSVTVFSEADRLAPHVKLADEAFFIGPAPVQQSYLNQEAIVEAIVRSGADAVHPGYGLLSESASFATAVVQAGAIFVGPSPEALALLGDKIRARALARSVGVPPPPGSEQPVSPNDPDALAAQAEAIGFPVLVKAAGGGGGIGMQIVSEPEKLPSAATTCSNRGKAAFGDPRIYLERYLLRPRHIEVQVFRDGKGHVLTLGDRECSVQRRHQKIVEEALSPAAFLSDGVREQLWDSAKRVIEAAEYRGAATVEFVADALGTLYFLEVNARLQVEHPVTESITGLDLVEWQLKVADGSTLPDSAPSFAGHAVEARLYAEDPDRGFVPQPGKVTRLKLPELEGVRIDSGIEEAYEVSHYYDPLLAKVVAHGVNRNQAISRLQQALAELQLELVGPKGPRASNQAFLRRVLRSGPFIAGEYDTGLVGQLEPAG